MEYELSQEGGGSMSMKLGVQIDLKTIVLATDFSEAAPTEVQYAAMLARLEDAKMEIVHVMPPAPYTSVPPDGWVPMQVETPEEAAKRAGDAESLANQLLEDAGGTIRQGEVFVETGDPGKVVRELVKQHKADLVVIGTKKLSARQKFMFGSTAQELLHSAECPVLLIGPNACDFRVPEKLSNVLYATDFSFAAEVSFAYALWFARQFGATLTMLHVKPNQPNQFSFDEAMETEVATRQMRELLAGEGDLPPVRFEVRFGVPADEIAKASEEQAAELIVVGTHGANMAHAASHFIGGTAYAVVRRAHCPVLTVRS
jgi:nucleotide-binding universal stress UspA family protein